MVQDPVNQEIANKPYPKITGPGPSRADGALIHLVGADEPSLAAHARSAIRVNPARARFLYAAAEGEWSTSIETEALVEAKANT